MARLDVNYSYFDSSNFNLEEGNVLVVGKSYVSDEFEKNLSETILEKAKRFYRDEDRIAYLSRHHSLNLILSKLLNSDPKNLNIEQNKYGKPFLYLNPFYFNVSKSADIFCLLFSNSDCGVDIEVIRDVTSMKVVADLHFHSEEKKYCEKGDFNSNFLTIWTRKESFLKAVGTGLTDDLSSLNTLENTIKLNDLSYQITTERSDQFIISACFEGTNPLSTKKFRL